VIHSYADGRIEDTGPLTKKEWQLRTTSSLKLQKISL
jgi:hypothetical protein